MSYLHAQIERITYANEETGYALAKVYAKGHDGLVSVVGILPSPNPGEILKMQDCWESHPKYGDGSLAHGANCVTGYGRPASECRVGTATRGRPAGLARCRGVASVCPPSTRAAASTQGRHGGLPLRPRSMRTGRGYADVIIEISTNTGLGFDPSSWLDHTIGPMSHKSSAARLLKTTRKLFYGPRYTEPDQ